MPYGYLSCLYLQANIALVHGDLAAATMYLDRAIALADEKRSNAMLCRCRLTGAAIAFAENRYSDGLGLLTDGLAMSRSRRGPANPWLPHSYAAQLYAIALEHGIEVEHVQGLIRRFKVAPPDGMHALSTWPFPVKVHTLGSFALHVGGEPVTFTGKAQKKPLELLKALIAFGGRQMREEKLADSLWPDADGAQAAQSLGVTQHRLRKLIGEAAIERQQGCLSLDPRYCWVDAWALERQLAAIEQRCGDGAFEDVIRIVEALFALYRTGTSSSRASLHLRERMPFGTGAEIWRKNLTQAESQKTAAPQVWKGQRLHQHPDGHPAGRGSLA